MNPYDPRLRAPLNEHRKRFGLRIPCPPAGCRLTEDEEKLQNEAVKAVRGVKGFIEKNVKSCKNKNKTIKSNKLFNLYKESQYFQGDDIDKFINDVIALGFSVKKTKNKTLFTGMEMKQLHHEKNEHTPRKNGVEIFIKKEYDICENSNNVILNDLYEEFKKSEYFKGENILPFVRLLIAMGFYSVKASGKTKLDLTSLRRKSILHDEWPCLPQVITNEI